MPLDTNRFITATTVEPYYKKWLSLKDTTSSDYTSFLEKKIDELRAPSSISTKAMQIGHTGERMIVAGITEALQEAIGKGDVFTFADITHYYELTNDSRLNLVFGATPDLLTKTRLENGSILTRTYEIKTIQTNFARLSNSMIEKDMFQTQWQSFICESDEIIYITAVVAVLASDEVSIITQKETILKPIISLHNNFSAFCNDTISTIAKIYGTTFTLSNNYKITKGVF